MLIGTLLGAVLCLAGAALGADAPQEVTDAVAKVADSGSYSWHAVTTNSVDSSRTAEDGQAEKSGWTSLKMNVADAYVRIIMKDRAGVINVGSGWKSADDLADQRSASRFVQQTVRNFRPPLVIAQQLLSQAGDIKQDADAWTSQLTGDDANALLRALPAFRGTRGTSGAKATIKFYLHDGVLNRLEVRATGSSSGRGGIDTPFDRSYTVEFSNVGSTSVEVPDEVKKKLDGSSGQS